MNMTDKSNNTFEDRLQYKSPTVKLVNVRIRSILCGSPGIYGYEEGSSSEGDME